MKKITIKSFNLKTMNYSTLKKTVALSFVSLMAVGMAQAQTTTTDTSKTKTTVDTSKTKTIADTSKMAPTTAKVFGGASQYNTWSVGVNAGATAPSVATGGVNVFNHNKVELGYGVSLKDQLSHSLGLQLDVHGGKLAGNQQVSQTDPNAFRVDVPSGEQVSSFETSFWSGTLSGVFNFGNISFLHRQSAINFFVSGGAGLAWYAPKVTLTDGTVIDWKGNAGSSHNDKYVKELVIPVGAGVKFKLSDQLDLNLGYTENFIDGFNLTGVRADFPAENRYSYGYAGLEYTFGSKSKPSLEWVNPVAMMYDELYDEALRQEVAALKGRVANVETAVNDLKKDSDGDGVSDQFDKCPNTPAGTVVDGSGCPIVFKLDTAAVCKFCSSQTAAGPVSAYSNIQFEFDSSVLKTSSYPILDATSADLRSSGAACELDGFASSEGTAAHNLRLSRDRANSVKTYLVNSGVAAKKLKVKAYGETHPIADNSTEAGRILNRRVEFKKK
ncbi:MAG TPA: OmpA family protein [Mucilaginibacter sp.]